MKNVLVFFFTVFALVAGVDAQDLSHFNLPDVASGKSVSLADFSSNKGIVIIFTSNQCPYDQSYIARVKDLSRNYNATIPIILVNAHTDANEGADNMKRFYEQQGLTGFYLSDKDQQLMQALDARKSPEAFVLRNTNGKFSVVYRGAIDDNAQIATDVRQSYLKDAIEKVRQGQKPDVAEIRPVGCNIRKK